MDETESAIYECFIVKCPKPKTQYRWKCECFLFPLHCLKFNAVLSYLQWAGCYIDMVWGLDTEIQCRFTAPYYGVETWKGGLN